MTKDEAVRSLKAADVTDANSFEFAYDRALSETPKSLKSEAKELEGSIFAVKTKKPLEKWGLGDDDIAEFNKDPEGFSLEGMTLKEAVSEVKGLNLAAKPEFRSFIKKIDKMPEAESEKAYADLLKSISS